MPAYLHDIYIDIREKKRESVDYRHQIGEKFGLDKVCRYKKKVDRGHVHTNGVHCTISKVENNLFTGRKDRRRRERNISIFCPLLFLS